MGILSQLKSIRKFWKINPKVRIKESKKLYRRNREKQNWKKEVEKRG